MRKKAWEVLRTYVSGQNEVLLKHSLAVEIAMRAYAEKFGQEAEYWGAVGLLHDVDFEKYPHEHPHHARELLSAHGYSNIFITDVESHARTWEQERTLLQKTLLAVDEMTGFIIACAMVRPDKSLDNLEVKSVLKKLKDKAFAKAVNRETILQSAAALEMELNEHIEFVTKALAQGVKDPTYQEIPLI
ncbi:MAG: HD domain-containing protein [Sporomusaceae bacterium]|jgi:predicted hydrolase (HD superfamily)|nr:HD domain-containing protein [Sporomusaceae bacterium]